MAIRDLGYRPYDGERHEAGRNTLVLLRHSMKRAWRSWIVKLALLFSWVPMTGFGLVGFLFKMGGRELEPNNLVYMLMQTQWISFGFIIALAGGAGAISYDINQGAFPYFFSKPVKPVQYLVGRVGAISILLFLVTFVPSALLLLMVVGTSTPDTILDRALLILPTFASAAIISVTIAGCAVGVSALSRSRALTNSAWIMLFGVPWALAWFVDLVKEWPWLRLSSVPSMLTTLVGTLFGQVEDDATFQWFHAAPVLAAVVVGCVALALHRVRKVEVIA